MLEGRWISDENLVAHNPSLTTSFGEVSVSGGASLLTGPQRLSQLVPHQLLSHITQESDLSVILVHGKPLEALVNEKELKHLW